MKKFLCKILSCVLTLPLALISITSCGENNFNAESLTSSVSSANTETSASDTSSVEEKTQAVVDLHTEEKKKHSNGTGKEINFEIPVADEQYQETLEGEISDDQQTTDEEGLPSESPVADSYEEYLEDVEDVESFIYGLVSENLQLEYDVFSSYVTLANETRVYGLGYTDFDSAYTLEGSEKTYFGAGFISFMGEPEISSADAASGLKMTRLGETNEEYGFLYTYSAEDYMAHTVVYDAYVQYGVQDKQLVYTEEKIQSKSHLERICDQSLGNLYSYDEEKWLLQTKFDFTPVNGVSLIEEMNYEALRKEIEDILAKQDLNFCKTEVETMVNVGKEALESYLLGLQEQTFCGYPVAQLIEIAEDMDPMTAIRITADGLVAIDIEPQPPEPPSAFVKWMVGIAAGICVAMTVVCTVVPGLQGFVPLAGALSGIAIEAAVEVIGENKHLNELNPIKLAVAGVAGALGGAASSLVADAVIGGASNAIFTLIDGGSLLDAGMSFAMGTVCGVAIGGAFKLAAKGVSKAFKAIKVKKIPVVVDAIDDNVVNKLDDSTLDAIKYNTGKAVKEAAEETISDYSQVKYQFASPKKLAAHGKHALSVGIDPLDADALLKYQKKASDFIESSAGNVDIKLTKGCNKQDFFASVAELKMKGKEKIIVSITRDCYDGATIYYDAVSNQFAVLSKNNYINTYWGEHDFIEDPMEYVFSQLLRGE